MWMPDLSWRDAVTQVLENSATPMHYTEVAQAIVDQHLRDEVGATPQQTVNVVISQSIKDDGEGSPFVRIDRGLYWLRTKYQGGNAPAEEPPAEPSPGLINAFGMYWSRSAVTWNSKPKILGRQQVGSATIDFSGELGVYLLHDGRTVVYVGRTTDQNLVTRLKQHTTDRFAGRWDRFSWFGVFKANEDGTLAKDASVPNDLNVLIATMEALLIEGLEPPQNRKRGDDFRAVEFLQVVDPAIETNKVLATVADLLARSST
jgi:HB1, ASXL, restriction endonuclease HTH domain